MSFTISTDVFCDGKGCVNWIEGTTGSRIERRRAMEVAASAGWKKVKGTHCVLCDQCVKEGNVTKYQQHPNP